MSTADLIARYDRPVPRYTSYPTAPHFSPAVGADRYVAWLRNLAPDEPISLYIHVPFCERLCLYCGCNTGVVRSEAPRRAYAALLDREIQLVAAHVGRSRVSHLHWGGGTPTTLPADYLTGLMARVRAEFDLTDGAEIAIELDPTALPADRLAALAAMGVTRVSLGVQDLDPAVQAAIGRMQSYEETESCAQAIRAIGVDAINLDLIYGLPMQSEQSVAETARRSLGLQAGRVAVFGYAHVPWMKRHQALIPESILPTAQARFDQRAAIGRVLEQEGGYLPVGLDHYARPDDALAQAAGSRRLHRSFQGYTTDAAPALIGIGASAIGCLPQGYVQNAASVPAYADSIRAGHAATERGVALSPDDRLRRAVIEQVMCDLRADLRGIAKAHAADPTPLLTAAHALDGFERDGLVDWDGAVVRVTEAGRLFVRNVAAVFDAYFTHENIDKNSKLRHAQAV
ncbi:MAG: oxygen-independent coproporphyrinogen III oxidase [Acidocella sp.]|nr:oxygen-independent coproporphyrinogen III oxidase [Acidocella sp.]